MPKYVIIRDEDQTITNVIEWDGETAWIPPDGHTVREYVPGDAVAVVIDPAERERQEARERASTAILANKGTGPWGAILYDLAISHGWVQERED